jgi:hypothetical protein
MAGLTAWKAGVLMKISMSTSMRIPACQREREGSRRHAEASGRASVPAGEDARPARRG